MILGFDSPPMLFDPAVNTVLLSWEEEKAELLNAEHPSDGIAIDINTINQIKRNILTHPYLGKVKCLYFLKNYSNLFLTRLFVPIVGEIHRGVISTQTGRKNR